jgi:hypothetical protein
MFQDGARLERAHTWKAIEHCDEVSKFCSILIEESELTLATGHLCTFSRLQMWAQP